MTSPSTRKEDLTKKFAIYRDILRVPEYFLFDPKDQYLKPRLQGFQLVEGRSDPIAPILGRLPSQILGLHLEGDRRDLRFLDPAAGLWLPNNAEIEATAEQAEAERQRAQQAAAEVDQLRRELDELRRRLGPYVANTQFRREPKEAGFPGPGP